MPSIITRLADPFFSAGRSSPGSSGKELYMKEVPVTVFLKRTRKGLSPLQGAHHIFAHAHGRDAYNSLKVSQKFFFPIFLAHLALENKHSNT